MRSITLFFGLFWDSSIGCINGISAAAGIRFRPDGRPPLFRQRGGTILRDVSPCPAGVPSWAPWWGDAPTGHPWPNGARSASMPNAPHHNTSTQPHDACFAVSLMSPNEKRWRAIHFLRLTHLTVGALGGYDGRDGGGSGKPPSLPRVARGLRFSAPESPQK
jgi:hypothetical protein